MEYLISDKDKQILRETAKKQLELANMESNKARIQEWYRHNALQGEKPMIHLEMGTFSQEIIPPLLKCEGAFAKQVETALYSNFLNQELFDDDRVTPDYFPMEYDTFFELFGIQIHVDHTQDASGKESLGHHFESIIEDLEEDYEKLVPGTKIKVTGYKSEWSGEVEITDATFEIVEGDTYLAPVKDVTTMLGTDELIDYQNQYVAFKGMTVEAAGQDESGNDVAYLYNWDGSGTDGDDLYFSVSLNGETYSFVVESYLCDNTTDVYAAVKNLQIGDVIDMEGYLYWYEGVNPHIISVTAAK